MECRELHAGFVPVDGPGRSERPRCNKAHGSMGLRTSVIPRGAWDLQAGAAAIGQRVGRSANFQGVYRPGDAKSAAERMNTGDTALGSQLAPQMGHISNSTRRWLRVRFVQPRANSDGQTQTTTQWSTPGNMGTRVSSGTGGRTSEELAAVSGLGGNAHLRQGRSRWSGICATGDLRSTTM
jgi:hypothetical protein